MVTNDKMNDVLFLILGIGIPFLGTTIGAFSGLFIKKSNGKLQTLLYGFSGGVMISASIFSLLIPSINLYSGIKKWLMPSVAILVGVLFMLSVDYFLSRQNNKNTRLNKMVTAITFHNLPEGMAVGITMTSALITKTGYAPCVMLAIGIAVQNIPEGAIISLPLISSGISRLKSVSLAIFSAVVEMAGCVLALTLYSITIKFLPFLLSLSSGAMIWVTVKELLPESKGNLATVFFFLGFILMLILDLI